jgi:hypothetical protein
MPNACYTPMIGTMNARVLPEPVLAAPRMSRPRRAKPKIGKMTSQLENEEKNDTTKKNQSCGSGSATSSRTLIDLTDEHFKLLTMWRQKGRTSTVRRQHRQDKT